MSKRMRGALLAMPFGVVMVIGLGSTRRAPPLPPQLSVEPARIVADGYDTATLTIHSSAPGLPRLSLTGTPHAATIDGVTRTAAHIRAGVAPGRVRIEVTLPGSPAAFAEIETVLQTADTLEDGTPDFLRLDREPDRQAFRRWFTYLAEAQYFHEPASRPAEIKDCAALIRYAYRESLRRRQSDWAAAARLPVVPPFDPVMKYRYPDTPLGPALFRVRSGAFRPSDLADGAFAQFADAKTLGRLNCHFVSRGLAAALPGDLLFFRQQGGEESFHSMIYIGQSQIEKDVRRRYFVYHSGPDGGDPGEMRRLSVDELQQFPKSEWRPLASNPNFLGVYRWNILCSPGTR